MLFGADRHLDGHRIAIKAFPQLIDHFAEIGPGAIHLVNEHHARHFILVCLSPYSFGLWLNAGRPTKNHHSTV